MIHTLQTKVEVNAITGTKQVAWLLDHYEVRTGSDMVTPAAPAAPTVPITITRRQFFRAVDASGLTASINAAMTTATPAQKIDFDEASEFERSNPVLIAMAKALGKTDTEVDALFILGATL